MGELSLVRHRPDQSAAVQVSEEILNTFPHLILAEDIVIHYSLTGARALQSLLQVHFGSQCLEVQREISEYPHKGWEELFELQAGLIAVSISHAKLIGQPYHHAEVLDALLINVAELVEHESA